MSQPALPSPLECQRLADPTCADCDGDGRVWQVRRDGDGLRQRVVVLCDCARNRPAASLPASPIVNWSTDVEFVSPPCRGVSRPQRSASR